MSYYLPLKATLVYFDTNIRLSPFRTSLVLCLSHFKTYLGLSYFETCLGLSYFGTSLDLSYLKTRPILLWDQAYLTLRSAMAYHQQEDDYNYPVTKPHDNYCCSVVWIVTHQYLWWPLPRKLRPLMTGFLLHECFHAVCDTVQVEVPRGAAAGFLHQVVQVFGR